jgi:hypothetical protein
VPALLALTDSTSQLKTRIDAMTIARVLTPMRRAVLGTLAIGALVVACETRRPDPVAPVTDYVMQEGRATAIAGNLQLAESVKVRVAGSMKQANPGALGEDPRKPVLLVHDAKGKVVFAGRMDSLGVLPFSPADIEAIEVVKRGDLLPREAQGGLISVKLKPEAKWTPPTPADSAWRYKSPAQPLSSTAEEAVSEASGPVSVTLEDAAGVVIYEGPWVSRVTDGVGPYRFAPNEAISSIDVNKSGGSKKITIRLKEGARLEKR